MISRENVAATVHPRVGGEQVQAPTCGARLIGSSPRGRGTGPREVDQLLERRFIPAWAGNSHRRINGLHVRPVHPRVGGEQFLSCLPKSRLFGSSPRGRGTAGLDAMHHTWQRFIPAWAGNSTPRRSRSRASAVHPRVGGEQRRHQPVQPGSGGSSPRGRGTVGHQQRITARVHPSRSGGSSPRGRGTVHAGIHYSDDERFIPAWAGNSCARRRTIRAAAVHPRVGGEQPLPFLRNACKLGSSPRGRGTAPPACRIVHAARFIPAWAGNSPMLVISLHPAAVHPRVGGEQSLSPAPLELVFGSSPRGRGTGRQTCLRSCGLRFIPAWAGNRASLRLRPAHRPVHPRVGGEQAVVIGPSFGKIGSSPRGRGTVIFRKPRQLHSRFIPAWAGNRQWQARQLCRRPVHPRVGGEQPSG